MHASLRLAAGRPPYEIEWRRCEGAVHNEAGDWAVDELVVRDASAAVVWSATNASEPTERWLETVQPTHFGGEDQLFVLTRVSGTGHAWEMCELGSVEAGGVGCWAEPAVRFEPLLSPGESAHHCQVSLSVVGLEYEC